ncbi:unnamed protein product [Effrenium voratum]|nr:unnamed protein product [Effrenium voratum]
MGCAAAKPSRPSPAPSPVGCKLLEFKVRGSKPGREFSAEMCFERGDHRGGSVPAQLVTKQRLPTDWKMLSFYATKVVFEYHNDQGPEHNVHVHDPQGAGVKFLGQNIYPTAKPPGCEHNWGPEQHTFGAIQRGHLAWRSKYEMDIPTQDASASHFLEFQVYGSTPGRLFSAYLMLQDERGQTWTVSLLKEISLPVKPEVFCFDVSQVAFTYHNDEGPEFNIHVDTAQGVRLLNENILGSAVLIGNNWGPENGDNFRWRALRNDGTFAWRGKYEMTPRSTFEVMEAPVQMPTYWQVDHTSLSKRVQETPETCDAIQELLNRTWESTITRDRPKEGADRAVKEFQVVQVLRNENPLLWTPYCRERERVRRRCEGKDLSGELKTGLCDAFRQTPGYASLKAEAREVYLFHGTRPSAANVICSSDFRLDFAGSHAGTMYGKGLYFAEASSKADEYASEDTDGIYQGLFCMLLCRVTLGDWIYCDAVKPDAEALVRGIQQGLHDSILGDREKARGTYREFIVFDNNQVYPEYIIIYKRLASRARVMAEAADAEEPTSNI